MNWLTLCKSTLKVSHCRKRGRERGREKEREGKREKDREGGRERKREREWREREKERERKRWRKNSVDRQKHGGGNTIQYGHKFQACLFTHVNIENTS